MSGLIMAIGGFIVVFAAFDIFMEDDKSEIKQAFMKMAAGLVVLGVGYGLDYLNIL